MKHFNFIFYIALISLITLSCKKKPVINNDVITFKEQRVEVNSFGWNLIGDFLYPSNTDSLPVVLMLNKAAGNRHVYKDLAKELQKRGIASLRVDLRGHGESINLGKFIPGKVPRDPIIWDAELDVISLHKYLKSHDLTGNGKIAIIGASYSGEEMAEAGRIFGYADAYIALSPGSFSSESILNIDTSGVPWFFISANEERFLKEITREVREKSKSVEVLIVPGNNHASELIVDNLNLTERIVTWLEYKLK